MKGDGKVSIRTRRILLNNRNILIRRGLDALDRENTRLARFYFEQAAGYGSIPLILSCLGYCLAREDGNMEEAFALCRQALRREPGNPLHHLHHGRVHLIAGEKERAVTAFRAGLRFGEHPDLLAELRRVGMRRPPLFTFLNRRHLLNRSCGFLLTRLGLRFLLHPMEISPEQT